MTYNLPNGSVWDFSNPWEEQEPGAINWMESAIDPNNNSSKKLAINIRPLFYTCVNFEGVEACFYSKNHVKSLSNGN